jgi:hypothetical protein
LSTLVRAETARPLTPLSPPDTPLVAQSRLRRLEPFPHAVHQTPRLPRPRNAFYPRILVASPLAGARSGPSRQRTVPELCNTLACRSTRVHTQSLRARHASPRLFTAARRATCRLWDSATESDLRTHSRARQTPTSAASCLGQVTPLLAERCQSSFVSLGVVRAPTLHNHHHATARAMAFPQPDLTRTPPVAS